MREIPSAPAPFPRLRVGFVLHSAKQDGAGKAAVELLVGLRPKGVVGFVLLPAHGPLEVEVRAVAEGVRIIPYRWWIDRATPWWKKILRSLWNLAMIVPVTMAIRRWRCDVVYSNTLTIPCGGFAARLLRRPHIWHFHELWGGETGFSFDLGERVSLKLVDVLTDVGICVSNAVRQPFIPWLTLGKLRTVYQSVEIVKADECEVSPVTKNSPGSIACVVSGALFAQKRQEDAVRAIAALHRDGIDAELWLLGQGIGEYEDALRGIAREEGVAHLVRFLGFHSNPFAVLRAADVALICSPLEACSRAAVEAMILGKVVIAARGGGNLELIESGVTGYLYSPFDAEDLARCIRDVVENPEIRRKMGKNARQWSSGRFARDRYASEIQEILDKVTEETA